MQMVGQSETEWLELKAAIHPEGDRFPDDTNADDYRWNLAKAVIALANSIGGVVLLGVGDDGRLVGIEASDPKGRRQTKGAEAFRREVILQQALLPANGWRTGRHGTFRLTNSALLDRLVALKEVPHGGQSVLAIFVDPAPKDFGFVEVEVSKEGAATERMVYLRKRGAVGQVVAVTGAQEDVLSMHEAQRQKLAGEIELVWRHFEESGRLARSAEELLPSVRQYVSTLETRLAPYSVKFTPLMAAQHGLAPEVRAKSQPSDEDDSWVRSEPSCTEESAELLRTKPLPRRGLATELLRECRSALLIGEGGSGKSRCLAEIALDAARNWRPGLPWPLLASLSAYTADGLAGLLEAESGIDWQDLIPRIQAGELTLCLDGLNECPDLLYDQCLVEIAGILHEYPRARLLLTSRTAELPPDLKLEIFELKPMDRVSQSQFLAGYLGQEQLVEPILAQLHVHKGGSVIAGSPMLLRIAAEVARESREIPVQRSALYCRFLDAWYRREAETARRSGQELAWDRELAIGALAELAFRSRQKGTGRIGLDQARSLLIHWLGEDVGSFIDWASQGTVLTRTADHRELVFQHETFQEYLCAEYLVARHQDMHGDLLTLRADAKPGVWAMPLAFSFEMLASPSPALMDAAWKVEPLIVAAGSREAVLYPVDEVTDDLWVRAVLHILLGQDASTVARAITIIARLPPKYPISTYLLTSLHNHSFWYSALTHSAGPSRIERLRALVCGGYFPWIELIDDALVGCEAWADGLSPSLRAIAGLNPAPTLVEVLSTASVSELCALRRREMISAGTFMSSWKDSLDRSPPERLDLDLLDILRTEKQQVNGILRTMLPRYREELSRIALEPDLSLRVLSILLRGGVIRAGKLREQQGFLANVCSRMSMMNAIRLARQGLLRRSDMDEKTRTRLIYDRNTRAGNIKDAIASGLLVPQDLPPRLRQRIASNAKPPHAESPARAGVFKFTTAVLTDTSSRKRINAELAKTRWKVVLKRIVPDRGFGFARHPDFEQEIFCMLSKIAVKDRSTLREGQELDTTISTRYDATRKSWGFAIESGRCVD